MIELSAKVLVRLPIAAREDRRKLLTLYLRHFPQHVPEKYGCTEPLKETFTSNDLDQVLDSWTGNSFSAARRNPKLLLNVHSSPVPSRKPRHSTISLTRLQSENPDDIFALREFVCDAVESFNADFGVAHILTQTELEERLEEVKRRQSASTTPEAIQFANDHMKQRISREGFAPVLWGMSVMPNNTVALESCLPDLSWVTVFGRPYVEMFGSERVLGSPVHDVRRLAKGGIGLTLTKRLEDNEVSFTEFKTTQSRCKEHLGRNAFCDPDAPPGYVYMAPEFEFPQEMYKRGPKSVIQGKQIVL
jgi:hypothetical protein